MNRSDLQRLSRLRERDAKLLLNEGHWHAAYYLAGYAVECALKAGVAKQTRRHDFPDKDLANKAWIHDLERLFKLTGLWPVFTREMESRPRLGVNWGIVKDWSEGARYDLGITEQAAHDLFNACVARANGVLPWIRKQW